MLEGVVTTAQGAVNAAIAANGSLVYVSGGAMGGGPTRIMSVDRTGRAVPLPGLPLDSYRDVRVSPNGRYLAVGTDADVWTYDTELGVLNRVTIDAARENSPLWTLDGNGIVYTSYQGGYPELFWRLANGTGSARRLLTRAKDLIDLFPNSWSQDGKQLLFTEVSASVRGAIGQVANERPSDVKILLKAISTISLLRCPLMDAGWRTHRTEAADRKCTVIATPIRRSSQNFERRGHAPTVVAGCNGAVFQ